MSAIVKSIQSDGVITVVFQNEMQNSSFTTNNFSLSSGTITSITGEGKTASITFENESRPLIINCNVTDLNGQNYNLSKAILREYNYKTFVEYIDLCNYYLNTPDTNLDSKIYYDVISGKLYYDEIASQFASDLNNFVLAWSVDNEEYLEPLELINGIIVGWMSPNCQNYVDNAWSFN